MHRLQLSLKSRLNEALCGLSASAEHGDMPADLDSVIRCESTKWFPHSHSFAVLAWPNLLPLRGCALAAALANKKIVANRNSIRQVDV